MKEHSFTPTIRHILTEYFGKSAEAILQSSELLQYINIKTTSVSKGSKSRGSFGNLYAIYVLVEDYLARNFDKTGNYSQAQGASFTTLLNRQRELPFGSKLQNHALNHRLNKEFEKYFPTSLQVPILRDTQTSEYWINENLLTVPFETDIFNISSAIITILNAYIQAKQGAFETFISDCKQIQKLSLTKPYEGADYLISLLRPNVDARIFEIVSFAILKTYYSKLSIFWGWTLNDISEENLKLFKTGRTNANDGGIDFVMRPLGRFFQVTESLDVSKYFLDIDKVQKYPISFVIKTELSAELIRQALHEQAERQFPVKRIIDKYMNSIEEIINIPMLKTYLNTISAQEKLPVVLDEVILHSKVEFNIE